MCLFNTKYGPVRDLLLCRRSGTLLAVALFEASNHLCYTCSQHRDHFSSFAELFALSSESVSKNQMVYVYVELPVTALAEIGNPEAAPSSRLRIDAKYQSLASVKVARPDNGAMMLTPKDTAFARSSSSSSRSLFLLFREIRKSTVFPPRTTGHSSSGSSQSAGRMLLAAVLSTQITPSAPRHRH